MDRVSHFRAVCFEKIGQILHYVLRLGHRHSITWHKYDRARRFQSKISIMRRDRFCFPFRARSCDRSTSRSKSAEENICKRSIHGLAHDLGKDDPARAHERPSHDQHIVGEDETSSSTGEARITV